MRPTLNKSTTKYDPAPFWANLFLYTYEEQYVKTTIASYPIKARHFHSAKGFIDDLCAINDRGEFGRVFNNIKVVEPMGYKAFLSNLNNCKYAITDSGGVQCEASVLNTPLITLRNSTEHLDTIEHGTNVLCKDSSQIKNIKLKYSDYSPRIWDGKSAERIVEVLKEI